MSSLENAVESAGEARDVHNDEQRFALVDTLSGILGEHLLAHHVEPGTDIWIRVQSESWLATGYALRDHCHMAYFGFLSAIDWQPSPYGRDMDAQVDLPQKPTVGPMTWGKAGGETRFQLLARVHDPESGVGVSVKADLSDDQPEVESWVPVYQGANWHEREAWEMFGINFSDHPNQVHLYLPGAFEGHPLRKDYPLLARRIKPWPGIVDVELMPGHGDDDEEGEGANESSD